MRDRQHSGPLSAGRIIERSGTRNPAALVIESLSGRLLRRLRVGRQQPARAGMHQRVSARSRAWERRRRTPEPPTIGKGEHASLRFCGSACSRTCDRSGARASDGKQHSGCVPGHAVIDGGRPAAARCSEPKRAGREDRSRARSRDSPEVLTAARSGAAHVHATVIGTPERESEHQRRSDSADRAARADPARHAALSLCATSSSAARSGMTGMTGRVSWAARGPAWDEACAQCAAAVIGTEWTSASFQVSPWRR